MSMLNAYALSVVGMLYRVANPQREEGQTMAEYALILAGVAVAVIAVIGLFGGAVAAKFAEITTAL